MVFAGLDKVDWASMYHAYGPATDVPDLLRDLLSDDSETREWALDKLSIGVHHQQDVYESTVACVPFLLEAALRPDGGDRPEVLQLVASIGGAGEDGIADWDEEEDGEDTFRNIVAARASIGRFLPELLALLDDEDPEVRRTVVHVLAACRQHWDTVLPSLQERVPTEPDPHARASLIAAMLSACGCL